MFTDLLASVGYEIGFTGKPWGPGNWKDAGWLQNPVEPEFNNKVLNSVPANGIRPNDYFGNFESFFNQKEKEIPSFSGKGAMNHIGFMKMVRG